VQFWGATWVHPYWGQFYSLSYLGMARGSALASDTVKAKKAFQDFFELWKDADPDVPILPQAKAEYAKLLRRLREVDKVCFPRVTQAVCS